jgi:selenocysteine lyase/cysteine desulfurase
MREQLIYRNFNVGAPFRGSSGNLRALTDARQDVAALFNCLPQEVVFGNNATTLTFHMSRVLTADARLNIGPGDNIVVTCMDHACNVGPWELLARDTGAELRRIALDRSSWCLDRASIDASIDGRTKLVAVGAASNLLGSVNDFAYAVARARAVGALSYVDGVHLAPHALIDVKAIGCDMLVCSPYKFFGPHVGTLYIRRGLAEELLPYKIRPNSDELPTFENCQGSRWEMGTQNYEGIAGSAAAVRYLASLARRFPAVPPRASSAPDRAAAPPAPALDGATEGQHRMRCDLAASWRLIAAHEARLTQRFLAGIADMPHIDLYGADLRRSVARARTGHVAGGVLALRFLCTGARASTGVGAALRPPAWVMLLCAHG